MSERSAKNHSKGINFIKKHHKKEAFWGYMLVLPAFLVLFVFHIGPALTTFWFSLTKWNGLTAADFIGFGNFLKMAHDKEFIHSIWHTLLFTSGSVFLSVSLATIFASLLNAKIRGKGIYRTIYFLPFVTMLIAVGTVWKWLFNSQYGLVNYLLGLAHLPQPDWLTTPAVLLVTIILAQVWHTLGYNLVILLAGLQSIPGHFYEAADIDGANSFQKFYKVTVPLLSPSLFFVIVISFIGAFKMFDLVFIITGNSPLLLSGTQTMVYSIYQQAFTYLHMGYGSAEAIVLFFIILITTLIQMYLQKRWVHYQ